MFCGTLQQICWDFSVVKSKIILRTSFIALIRLFHSSLVILNNPLPASDSTISLLKMKQAIKEPIQRRQSIIKAILLFLTALDTKQQKRTNHIMANKTNKIIGLGFSMIE
ncbi:hypothetical protein [Helicobacter cetorum]|uniref:hypothetical protein n=1 Tax=Helicobacter cetorum TaxID=138563 RepID=UPI0012DC0973|nr:hypothetical protein [Helicobacter cetorum]